MSVHPEAKAVGFLHFPYSALDQRANSEYSQRARSLRSPTRSEIGPMSASEWLYRLYFFSPGGRDDVVVSVCGTSGVVATEIKRSVWPLEAEPQRETYRLDEIRASVFRDTILRIQPWEREPNEDVPEAPCIVVEFIEGERYACLTLDRPDIQSPEYELVQAFCALWGEHTKACREHIESC